MRSALHRIAFAGAAPLASGELDLFRNCRAAAAGHGAGGRDGGRDDLPHRRPLERAGGDADDGTGRGIGLPYTPQAQPARRAGAGPRGAC